MTDGHREYVVDDRAAARMAAAAVRVAFTQPRMLVVTGIIVVAATVVGAAQAVGGSGLAGAITGFVIGLVLVTLMYVVQRGQLRRAFAARGYRPGSLLRVDYGQDGFTISTPEASARHPYANIAKIAIRDDVVVLVMMPRPRVMFVLPRQLVPADRIALMRSGTVRRSAS